MERNCISILNGEFIYRDTSHLRPQSRNRRRCVMLADRMHLDVGLQ